MNLINRGDASEVVLKRFSGGVELSDPAGSEDTRTLLILDTETTGLDSQYDNIIELALVQLSYDRETGAFVEHVGTWGWFEDPGMPIPEEITQITGITDEDVSGKQIPDEAEAILKSADLILAHNAAFDRGFCVRRFPFLAEKFWACSLNQVDWVGIGLPVAKQEILAVYHGFFYDAHRAETDVEALAKLLQMSPPGNEKSYFQMILDDLRVPYYRVRAVGTPFEAKDELKSRGYSWDPERKHWWKDASQEQMEAESPWLDELYQRFKCGSPNVEPIPPIQRFAY